MYKKFKQFTQDHLDNKQDSTQGPKTSKHTLPNTHDAFGSKIR